MTTIMSQGGYRRQEDPPELNELREWDLLLQANNTANNSRRFSASSNIREDITRLSSSFRSNLTISSTAASSPGSGYPIIKDEIDPSTYSFTSALKALQAKSGFHTNLECCLSPKGGLALHSKWNDAEKYISNPHSGHVPMECLSATSFRNLIKNQTTIMSAPLLFYNNLTQTKLPSSSTVRGSDLLQKNITIQEKKEVGTTRDVGIQIGTPDGSSSSSNSSNSLSPAASTPSIQDRAPKRYGISMEVGESSNSSSRPKSDNHVERKQDKGDQEDDESSSSKILSQKKLESEKEIISDSDEDSDSESHCGNHRQHIRRCGPSAGCLPWMVVKKQPLTKPSKNNKHVSFKSFKKSYLALGLH